jgi:hypothetical protein
MEHMGFVVGAKLSRRWFNGRKHKLGSDPSYVYPPDMVDTKIVSMDFLLRYEKVRAKFDGLVRDRVYTKAAVDVLKEKTSNLLGKKFIGTGATFSGELDTLAYCEGDIQKLHHEFRVQVVAVSSSDSLNGRFGLTDLTASLANFNLAAAIANARVHTEKYYNYSRSVPTYCCQFHVEVTHIYVYARDSYSFGDITGQKASQYLGHWNRNGVILVGPAVVSDRANRYGFDIEWGNAPFEPGGFDRPVDTLEGRFGEMRKKDVYYPVHNRDYSVWREKYNRGGDFVIFTMPVKIKLPKPIKFTTEEICKPAPQPSGK